MSVAPLQAPRGGDAPGPTRGSLRVQAWIYTVINPLVDWCDRDLRLLRAWNLTWSRVTGHAESVRAGRDQLGAGGRLNLEDLLRHFPEVGLLLEAQERQLFLAVEAARETHLALIDHAGFRGAVLSARGRHESPETDLVADMAVAFINGGDDDETWVELKPRLEHLPGLDAYDGLRERLRTVAAATAELSEALVALRALLCEEFDLPPSPIPVHTIIDRR